MPVAFLAELRFFRNKHIDDFQDSFQHYKIPNRATIVADMSAEVIIRDDAELVWAEIGQIRLGYAYILIDNIEYLQETCVR
jgi:hypothetical protein